MADIAAANQIPVEMIPVATQNTGSGDTFVAGTAGLMTADEKTKLAGIAEGANNYSPTSASTSTAGIVKLYDGTDSTATDVAATANAVHLAMAAASSSSGISMSSSTIKYGSAGEDSSTLTLDSGRWICIEGSASSFTSITTATGSVTLAGDSAHGNGGWALCFKTSE